LQLQTLWPFPEEEVAALARRVRFLVVAEMNLGQLAGEVKKAAGGTEVVSLTGAGGKLFMPAEILEALTPAGGRRLKRVVHQ
jgi:2-oxoglutarate ferredoxin oxidoreductase subunit alpha